MALETQGEEDIAEFMTLMNIWLLRAEEGSDDISTEATLWFSFVGHNTMDTGTFQESRMLGTFQGSKSWSFLPHIEITWPFM